MDKHYDLQTLTTAIIMQARKQEVTPESARLEIEFARNVDNPSYILGY